MDDSRSPVTGRWLRPESRSPAQNMAIDQALLEAADAGDGPVLRFYQWSEPTLSLGYFQPRQLRQHHRESDQLPMVRRATGGGAIVHHHELTYSLVVRLEPSAVGARTELYRGVHQVFAEAIAAYGLKALPHRRVRGRLTDPDAFLCFQRRTDEDLVACGYKLLGSAQRRGRRAILQHGSLLLRASSHAPQLPGLEDLAPSSIDVDIDSLAEHLSGRIAAGFGWRLRPGEFRAQELVRAEQIESERFANPSWLEKR